MKKTHMTGKRGIGALPLTTVAGAVVLMLGVMAQPVYAQSIVGTVEVGSHNTGGADNAAVDDGDTLTLDVTTASDLTVTDAQTTADDGTSALTVTGNNASTDADYAAVTVTNGGIRTDSLNTTGNSTVGGTLGVTGDTVIGTAAVAHTGVDAFGNPTGGSDATSATLEVTGNVTIGTAAVTGINGVGQINARSANLTVNGDSTTTGISALNGHTTIGLVDNPLTSANENANLTVNGNSTTTGTSTLNGHTTIGTATANANLTVNGNTTLNGTTTINGTINIGGNDGTDVEMFRSDGNGILLGRTQTQLRGGSSTALNNDDAALLTLSGHNASLLNRTGHGVTVTQSQTVISGGTESSSITLADNQVEFSNGMAAGAGPVKVTGVANGTGQYDAVNFGQLQDLERDLSKGVAATTAAANIPQVAPGKTVSVGAGLGGYNGETAVAVGLHYRLSENAVVRATVATGGKKAAYGLGAAFSW